MGTRRGRVSAIVAAVSMFALGVLMFPANATFGEVTEWTLPPSAPHGIALGPDGNVWYVARGANEVGRVTPNGQITTWPIPTASSGAWGIAAGPDNAMWFTERSAHQIGRIDMHGNIREFPLPELGRPHGITWGPDGRMWFAMTSANRIGRIDTVSYAIETFGGMSIDAGPLGIATGPDGNVWFTERDGSRIGRIAPDGSISEYALRPGLFPMGIALGPDGGMWFTEWFGNAIGRIDPYAFTVQEKVLPAAGAPAGIALGPDGGMWFAEENGDHIGRIDPVTWEIQEFRVMDGSKPFWVTGGSDGNVWFTGSDSSRSTIGRVDAKVPDTTAPTITIAAPSEGATFSVDETALADYSCRDEPGGSGVKRCDGPVATGQPIDTATAGEKTFEVTAVDEAGNQSVATVTYTVVARDTIAPNVTIRSPFDGAGVVVGQQVLADYSCTDEEGGSGVKRCDGPVATGQPIDTSSAGVKTFEVTAVDAAGNRAVASVGYVVFSEWDSRVALPPTVTTAPAGTPLLMVFGLGGDRGMDIFQPGYPMVRQVGCGAALKAMGDPLEAEDWPDLRFANGRYHYTWRTDRSWAGTCRELVLGFSIDGSGWTSVFVRFQ